MFSGISNVEEVAFNALSFVWNPSEEAKVNRPAQRCTHITITQECTDTSDCKASSMKVKEQVEVLEENSGKVEQVDEGEKEWLRWEWRNLRNVFGPKALVTTTG